VSSDRASRSSRTRNSSTATDEPRRGVHGRGRTRCHCGRASPLRRPATEEQRRHTLCTLSAAPPDSGKVSGQLTCRKGTSCERLRDSPHTVSCRPGSQAWTSPAGSCAGRSPRRTTARRPQRSTACRASRPAPRRQVTVLAHWSPSSTPTGRPGPGRLCAHRRPAGRVPQVLLLTHIRTDAAGQGTVGWQWTVLGTCRQHGVRPGMPTARGRGRPEPAGACCDRGGRSP
jgi:hypothetical protein